MISQEIILLVRPTRFTPSGHKLRTVSDNKNPHPGWGVGISMVRPTRFERATYRVGVCHSIQLSYERIYEINGEVPVIAF